MLLWGMLIVKEFDWKVLALNGLNMPLSRIVPIIGFLVVPALRPEPVDLILMFLAIEDLLEVSMPGSRAVYVVYEQGSHLLWLVARASDVNKFKVCNTIFIICGIIKAKKHHSTKNLLNYKCFQDLCGHLSIFFKFLLFKLLKL